MCGRFALTASPRRLQERFGLAALPAEVEPHYNVAPSQPIWVIPNRDTRLLRPARWGLIPPWASAATAGNSMINARAESLHRRAPFADALMHRRCLIPADGFYEWRRDGRVRRPFFVRLRDGQPMALAGLWAVWRPRGREPMASCTVITAAANAVVRPIHDRMPVVLGPQTWETWLAPQARAAAALLPMLVPCPAQWLEAYEVSPRVNAVANDGPDLIAPLTVDDHGGR